MQKPSVDVYFVFNVLTLTHLLQQDVKEPVFLLLSKR